MNENKIVRKILSVIDEYQNCNVNCNKVMNNWIITGVDNKLFLEFSIINNTVTFNEVLLINKRKGTLSEIVNFINKNGFDVIIVSVITPQMFKFCEKHKFKLYERGIGFGTYIKKAKNT